MSRYRKIDQRIWNDAKFAALSDSGKLVFFMLLTHPSMTALGAMRATLAGLAEELGWTAEAFREAFREVMAGGMAEHDQKACLIALPNFIRYNPPESPNVVKAWVGALDMLPECGLKNRVIARSKAFAEGMTKGFAEALPEAFAKAMPYQEQEQEQEQEQRKPLPATPPAPPGKPGAVTPIDPVKDEIWKSGRALLEGQGESRDGAGAFLGKLCKEYGQILVLEAVRDAVRTTPAEVKGWLTARCQERRAQSGNKSAAIERRNHAAAEAALREVGHG